MAGIDLKGRARLVVEEERVQVVKTLSDLLKGKVAEFGAAQMEQEAIRSAEEAAQIREGMGITQSLGPEDRIVDVTDTQMGQLSSPEPLFELGRQIREEDIKKAELPEAERATAKPEGDFTESFVNEMAILEGLGGDTVLGDKEPTYSYGITKRKADELGMSPDQFGSMREFATTFSKKYIEEKEETYSDIFDGTLSQNARLGLHSYLFNAGKFYPAQLRALRNNDLNGFIVEMQDVINTEGKSMIGLSKRRAAEANIIGKDTEGWTPIATVRASGSREKPVYEWLSSEGEVLFSFSNTKPMHPKSKMGEVGV